MTWKNKFPKENRYFETENGILYKGDCLEIMKRFPKKFFDLVLTDPPYGNTSLKWDKLLSFEKIWKILKEIRKENATILLFAGEQFSPYLRMSNIKEFKYDLIWIKNTTGCFFQAKYRPLNYIEYINVFGKFGVNSGCKIKPKYYPQTIKKVNLEKITGSYAETELGKAKKSSLKKGKPYIQKYSGYPNNLLYFKNDDRGLHPTQKPLALIEYLVKTYTLENDVVLDFTCGSGTSLVACEKLNRRWIGIEIEEKYCKIAKQRIKEIKK